MKTDREILLDLLPGCEPSEEASGYSAPLPDGAWLVVDRAVWWQRSLTDPLACATPEEAREEIAAHLDAWLTLVSDPRALYQFAGAGPERPAPMTMAQIEAANPDARELLRMLAPLPVGWTVTLPDGSAWTRVEGAC